MYHPHWFLAELRNLHPALRPPRWEYLRSAAPIIDLGDYTDTWTSRLNDWHQHPANPNLVDRASDLAAVLAAVADPDTVHLATGETFRYAGPHSSYLGRWADHAPTDRIDTASGTRYTPGGHIAATAHVALTAHVHPSARIEPGARIGHGTTIAAHAHIGAMTTVAACSRIAAGARIGNHCEIGLYGQVGTGADLGNFVELGRHARVGAGSTIPAFVHVSHDANIPAGTTSPNPSPVYPGPFGGNRHADLHTQPDYSLTR